MTDQYTPDRQGTGRRMTDEHCGNHEDHTSELAAQKASNATVRWMIGIGLPAMVAFMIYSNGQQSEQLKTIQYELSGLKNIINAGATTAATTQMQIDQIKQDVRELKARAYR